MTKEQITMDDYLGDGDANDVREHMAVQKEVITPLADKFREIATLEKRLAALKDESNLPSSVSNYVGAKTYTWETHANYKTGVSELNKAGEKPFNLKKNWEARLEDKELFITYQDSTTGIIYSGGSKFKVDLDCQDLEDIHLSKDPVGLCLNVDYKKNKGREYDKDKVICNKGLTEIEFLSHKVYQDILGQELMQKIAHEVYHIQGRKTALGLYLKDDAKNGELRSVVLGDGGDSDASGRGDLDDVARFVRDSPKK